ncbi:MAG: type II toxin-antitoxin system VapC family toxin [Dehalococcoidia bacterium]
MILIRFGPWRASADPSRLERANPPRARQPPCEKRKGSSGRGCRRVFRWLTSFSESGGRNLPRIRIVLDASVVLAHLGGEIEPDAFEHSEGEAAISAVNLAEVVAKLDERSFDPIAIQQMLSAFGMEVFPFDEPLAVQSGLLRSRTRRSGLSLGDRACLALAQHLGVPAATTDRAWQTLDTPVEIRLLR